MSVYKELQNNSDKLETLIASSDFNLAPYFLSDDEMIKKMLSIKNPGITKGQLDLMVDGVNKYKVSYDNKIKSIDNDNSLTNEEKIKRKDAVNKETKEDLGTSVDNVSPSLYKVYPINKEGFTEELSKKKSQVTAAMSIISREAKYLPKNLANASLLSFSGISGGALLSTTIPIPNLPGTIALLSTVIEVFFKIIDKIKNIIASLSFIKELKYLVDDDKISSVVTIINSFLKIIIGLFSPISLLEKQIKKILEFLTNLFSNDNIEKNIRSVTKRLRKLDFLPRNNFSRVDAEDIDEVNQILDQYEVVDKNSRTNAVRLKDDLTNKLKSQLSDLNNTVDNSVSIPNPSELNFNDDEFVYDVKLPDGTNLYGLTQDELDDLETYYDLKLNNI